LGWLKKRPSTFARRVRAASTLRAPRFQLTEARSSPHQAGAVKRSGLGSLVPVAPASCFAQSDEEAQLQRGAGSFSQIGALTCACSRPPTQPRPERLAAWSAFLGRAAWPSVGFCLLGFWLFGRASPAIVPCASRRRLMRAVGRQASKMQGLCPMKVLVARDQRDCLPNDLKAIATGIAYYRKEQGWNSARFQSA